MGETFGGLTGGIMAIGLIVGSEKLEDVKAYRKAMEYSYMEDWINVLWYVQ